jgi:hypothetical protein
MTTNRYITVGGKDYIVRARTDGTTEVLAQWEAFNVAERGCVCRSTVTRTKAININGRTGKKVLAAAQLVGATA